MTLIFLDTNIPIYASGAPHLYKEPCSRVIEFVGDELDSFRTDAEVLQELVHRYLAINRWALGKRVFDGFAGLMRGRVEPVFAPDVVLAAKWAGRWPGLEARDLLHLAVMDRIGCTAIVSADQKFALVPHIQRLDPADLPHWRNLVEA